MLATHYLRPVPPLTASALGVALLTAVAIAEAWDPLPVSDDPLVRMPGTQQTDGVTIDPAGQCMNCHDNYDAAVEPGSHWAGSLMAQAGRDPLFWASLTVAAQDSIWAVGRPNATDLCLRCHAPRGWTAGRSDPTNGSALAADDFDGLVCETCHKQIDPFFEDTFAGTREGSDWVGYWDETDASATPSSAAAAATRLADQSTAAAIRLFNGNDFFDASYQPVPPGYTEAGAGQYFLSAENARRGPFADAEANHSMYYSRAHKSRHFCGTCHDVSNPVLINLPFAATLPGDGTTVLPSEQQPAFAYGHLERTFSEFMLSDFGVGPGAPGIGPYDPSVFDTSHPNDWIATCQDCHLPDGMGAGADKNQAVVRPTNSVEHPKSGQPVHDLMGGNTWVGWLLASAVPGSPNYDAGNEALLDQGPAVLTMDLNAGEGLRPDALLDAVDRALVNLQRAASIDNATYDGATGQLDFFVQNQTGHKLISGYPEGRRMFVNVQLYTSGLVSHEVNPYDDVVGTLVGLDPAYSPASPAAGPRQEHRDELVYEILSSSSLTGESHTFHMALTTERYKDNRIPPPGFRIAEAAARMTEPYWAGAPAPGYFTSAEYLGGYDAVQLTLPAGADGVVISLYYQATSREFVEFLRDEINGTASTLSSPTPSGEPAAYIVQSDAFFDGLAAWGNTIWQLWDDNKSVPGAAPVLMTQVVLGDISSPCDPPGSDGTPCEDLDACTLGDTCLGGACDPGAPVVCQPLDECHDAGVCDPLTGLCSDPPLPDGTPCTGGTCQGGVCIPGGTGGSGGVAGTGGVGGAGGTAGTGGTGGTAGTGGTGGTAGAGGTGGTAGAGGTGGTAGTGGTGGTAGTGGSGGAAAAGGVGGTAGAAGFGGGTAGGGATAGMGGTAGAGGAGAAGGTGAASGTGGVGAAAGTGGTAGTATTGGSEPTQPTPEEDGGCGCRIGAPGHGEGRLARWLLATVLGVVLRRRTRTRTGALPR